MSEYTKDTGVLQINDLKEVMMPVPYPHQPPAIVVSLRQYEQLKAWGVIR